MQREQEQEEQVRRAREEEEERLRREAEGVDSQPVAEEKKEEAKVEKPEPATEKIGPLAPSSENVDSDFKPVILDVWLKLCSNYKQQMKKVFKQVRG